MNKTLVALLLLPALFTKAAEPGSLAKDIKNAELYKPHVIVKRGVLKDEAEWIAKVPANWNGTLLLYGRGYSTEKRSPMANRDGLEEPLLAAGYALAASQYPSVGWAVAEAIPSQILALEAFTKEIARPKQTIAMGSSMGGLVSAALLERYPDHFDGGLTMCSSAFGSVPMMNMALDGAFALTKLLGIGKAPSIVGAGDDFENITKFVEQIEFARKSPEGRARVALAGVLGGIPDWTHGDTRPNPDDYAEQERQIALAIQMGVFLPRGDQEHRAGGVFSWNDDVDYKKLFQYSGRQQFVKALYSEAGLDLDSDLAQLNAAVRIKANPNAVAYMRENYTPTGHVKVPVVSIHNIGDDKTSPALQHAYTRLLNHVANKPTAKALWVERAGHCKFEPAEVLFALSILEDRIKNDSWPEDKLSQQRLIEGARLIDFQPFPVPRSCVVEPQLCEED